MSVITPVDKSQNTFLSTIAIAKLLLLHILRTIAIGIAIAKELSELLLLLLILLRHHPELLLLLLLTIFTIAHVCLEGRFLKSFGSQIFILQEETILNCSTILLSILLCTCRVCAIYSSNKLACVRVCLDYKEINKDNSSIISGVCVHLKWSRGICNLICNGMAHCNGGFFHQCFVNRVKAHAL